MQRRGGIDAVTDLFDLSQLPSGEPTTLVIGDLWRWRRTDLSDLYDPTTYDLKYSAKLLTSAGTPIDITATSDATGFYVDVGSATTDTFTPGDYSWQAYIIRKSDSERIRVDNGRWTFVANFDTDTEDRRSHAKKMIDMLESVLENRADDGVLYYMIGNRQISKIPPAELRKLLNDYRAEYKRELAKEAVARGDKNPNSLTARFVN